VTIADPPSATLFWREPENIDSPAHAIRSGGEKMNRAVFVATVVVGMLVSAVWGFSQSAEELQSFLARLQVGKPVTYRNLTVVPVSARGSQGRDDPRSVLTLDQALELGVLEIREKDSGDVPWVVVSNHSDRRIFVMGGEILSGCKQDRIVARDVLIAPRRKRLLLPVYCVESGRWHHVSGEFKSEKNLGTYTMRAAAQDSSGNNQMEVWNKVAESNRKMGVRSDTEAYQDAFRSEEVARLVLDVEQKLKDLPSMEKGITGVIIAVGERIIGVDIFVSSELFQAMWPKIVKACVVAMSDYEQEAALSAEQAEQFLKALQWMRCQRRPGVDLGFEYFGELKDFTVNTLVYEDTMFHLGAVAHE
jgi:hypothetical protein